MTLIGYNPDENERLYRCPECRRVLDSGEACCAPAPFCEEAEEMANRESREWKRKARND